MNQKVYEVIKQQLNTCRPSDVLCRISVMMFESFSQTCKEDPESSLSYAATGFGCCGFYYRQNKNKMILMTES